MPRVTCHNCFGHPMVSPGCRTCGGDGMVIVPSVEPVTVPFEAVSDVRMALWETFMDYAERASNEGKHFESDTWRKAADIARHHVVARRVPL